MNNYSSGGLNFLDFSTLNNTFKVNWIKHYLKEPTSVWNIISSHIFSNLGGLKFLLLCNYNIDRIPVSLSNFHKQTLLAWSLIYKHNFSPNRYFIWNNRDVCYKRRSLFFDSWFRNGIVQINQLFNKEGNLFNYQEFLSHYKIPVTPKDFAVVFDAIPSGVIMLFKGYTTPPSTVAPLPDPIDTPIGKLCFLPASRKNNKKIRSLFLADCVSVPYVITTWNTHVQNLCWGKIWTLPNRYLLVNKVKEISFKIIHRCYPVKTFLVRFIKDIDVSCTFCNVHPETVFHLFWTCEHTRNLWQGICRFILDHIHETFVLCLHNVLFGFIDYQRELDSEFFSC